MGFHTWWLVAFGVPACPVPHPAPQSRGDREVLHRELHSHLSGAMPGAADGSEHQPCRLIRERGVSARPGSLQNALFLSPFHSPMR